MEFSSVQVILKDMTILVKEIEKFRKQGDSHFQNARRAIFLFRELCDYLSTALPDLNQWLTEYLEKNKEEIFITWWADQMHEWATNALESRFHHIDLYPTIKEEWDYMFGDDPTTCYKTAYNHVMELISKKDIKQCDDCTITAIHDELPHNGDWWGCDRCEDQEHLWKAELQRRLNGANHPLLNMEKRKSLIYSVGRAKEWARNPPSSWKPKQFPSLEHWSPPHKWGYIHEEREREKPCYQLEEYKNNNYKKFKFHASKGGQTRIQAITPFLYDALTKLHFSKYGLFYSKDYKEFAKEYDAFFYLWNRLEMIPFWIDLYIGRLNEIEKMF